MVDPLVIVLFPAKSNKYKELLGILLELPFDGGFGSLPAREASRYEGFPG